MNKEKLTDQNRPVTSDDLIDGKYLLAQKGKKNYYLLERMNTIYPVNAVRESRKIRSRMASMEHGSRNMLQLEY